MKKKIIALLAGLMVLAAVPAYAVGATFTRNLPGQTCWGAGHTVHIHVKNIGGQTIDRTLIVVGVASSPFELYPQLNTVIDDGNNIPPGFTRVGDLNFAKIFSTQQGSGNPSFIRVWSTTSIPPTIQVWYSCS